MIVPLHTAILAEETVFFTLQTPTPKQDAEILTNLIAYLTMHLKGVHKMLKWYKEEPHENPYQFRDPERHWISLTPLLHIDARVATVVAISNILGEVNRILNVLPRGVDRIEVVPHQWEWDENFLSVGIYLNTSTGVFWQVYSLAPQKKGWAHHDKSIPATIVAYCQALNLPASVTTGRNILAPFEGYVSV